VTLDCWQGPMCGLKVQVNAKAIPKLLQFRLQSKESGIVFAAYQYDAEWCRYAYVNTYDHRNDIKYEEDCLAVEYLPSEGKGRDRVDFRVWKTVGQIRNQQGVE
jgi:hypothetical protein